jgi:DNA gyrase/topoisomerase IV subunit A
MISETSIIDIDHKASNVIYEDSTFYMSYLAESKLANRIDGLKAIYRRILWAFYNIQNRHSYILPNFQKMLGSVMEFHAHGDSQIKESIDRFSQNVHIEIPLIRSDGSEGSYIQEKGAEARYRKVGLSDFAYDLFFSKIDIASIPMKKNDNLVSDEPIYLVGRIPTNLWIYNLTIGSGFKSICPPRSLSNICDLVKIYITTKDPITNTIKPTNKFLDLFIPSFPIYNTICNLEQIRQDYHNLNFSTPIVIRGWVSITNDSIIVHTFPYGVLYKNMKEEIIKKASTKSHWLNDSIVSIKDLSNHLDYSDFTIIFKRNINIFKVLKRFQDEFKCTSTMYPTHYFTDQYGKIYQMTPIELLQVWYEARRIAYINFIKKSQLKLEQEYHDLSAALAVVDHKEEVVKIIKDDSDNDEHAIRLLQNRFHISRYKANLILHLNLKVLVKTNKIELLDKRDKITTAIKTHKSNMAKIDDLIYQDADYFQETYSTPAKTRVPTYIGYVFFPSQQGLIQFETYQELHDILNTFSGSLGYITLYQSNQIHYIKSTTPSFTVSAQVSPYQHLHVQQIFSTDKTNTQPVYLSDTTSAFLLITPDTRINVTEGGTFLGVHDPFYVIPTSGKIRQSTTSEFTVKTSINDKSSSRTDKDILYAFNSDHDALLYIVYVDTDFPNALYIQPIFDHELLKKRIVFGVRAKIKILDVTYNFKKIYTVPPLFTKKNNTKYIDLRYYTKLDDKLQEIIAKHHSPRHPYEIVFSQLKRVKGCMNMVQAYA